MTGKLIRKMLVSWLVHLSQLSWRQITRTARSDCFLMQLRGENPSLCWQRARCCAAAARPGKAGRDQGARLCPCPARGSPTAARQRSPDLLWHSRGTEWSLPHGKAFPDLPLGEKTVYIVFYSLHLSPSFAMVPVAVIVFKEFSWAGSLPWFHLPCRHTREESMELRRARGMHKLTLLLTGILIFSSFD